MIDVIYEDNHLLAVNKPAGLLTQPTKESLDSLKTQVKAWIKEKYKKPGNVFLGVIHRLDRPVSGIVLFAKTSKALSRLNALIRSRNMRKTYCALVENAPPQESGTLEHFLRHDEYSSAISQEDDKEAKAARLQYVVIKKNLKTTLLQIDLDTGRYHQIRTQLAAIGCPIIGDHKYGSQKNLYLDFRARAGARARTRAKGNIALHHWRLELDHPITHAHLSLEASLPEWSCE